MPPVYKNCSGSKVNIMEYMWLKLRKEFKVNYHKHMLKHFSVPVDVNL
jgi:hypothetical protein